MQDKSSKPQKILLVRNDNIGDLICSIPAIQLIRKTFPNAQIHLLVNSYNAPVVECLVPHHVNRLIVYRKTKHVGLSVGQILHLTKFYLELLQGGYDATVLLVGGVSRQSQSFARWSRATRIIGYATDNEGPGFKEGLHEVEYSWNLAKHLCGIDSPLPDQIDYPIRATGSKIGIQVTSRKPGNRWSSQNFVDLIKRVHEHSGQKPMLLWSPGDAGTATHPGDDDKAAEIMSQVSGDVDPHPTATLKELIECLKQCKCLLTPDGGAMHLAAAMGIQIVAMYGQSDPVRWQPWTAQAITLQSPSKTIQDISVDEVVNAWKNLIYL